MRILSCFLLLVLPAAAQSALPLRDGESLTYRVTWSILPAGEIEISAHEEPGADGPRLLVTTHTYTRGVARLLLAFDAVGKSLFDPTSGRLLSLTEESDTRGEKDEHAVRFDYDRSVAVYTPGDGTADRDLPMPEGEPLDLIMALLQTRRWEMSPGDQKDALVLFDDEFYELTIHAESYEDVQTPMGKYRTLVLSPRMEKTPPKGMFKRGSTVRVWIAQDDLRLPVRFEVEFRVGSGVATLIRYQPPTGADDGTGANARGVTGSEKANASNPRP